MPSPRRTRRPLIALVALLLLLIIGYAVQAVSNHDRSLGPFPAYRPSAVAADVTVGPAPAGRAGRRDLRIEHWTP